MKSIRVVSTGNHQPGQKNAAGHQPQSNSQLSPSRMDLESQQMGRQEIDAHRGTDHLEALSGAPPRREAKWVESGRNSGEGDAPARWQCLARRIRRISFRSAPIEPPRKTVAANLLTQFDTFTDQMRRQRIRDAYHPQSICFIIGVYMIRLPRQTSDLVGAA